MLLGSRPTPYQDPSSRLAITDMGRKLGSVGLCPHLTQCGQAEAYLHGKFDLDPSNHLATIHQRHRHTDRTGQDRQTGQRSDSIGRTVLQTVAQNVDDGDLDVNHVITAASYQRAHTPSVGLV